MKALFINISCLLSILILFSINTFGQAGNFDVDNRTDCDAKVVLHYTTIGNCTNPGTCGPKIGTFTAYANSTTTVHNGSGIGVWTDIDMVEVNSVCLEYDGICNGSGALSACDCDGNDVAIVWVDCNNAYIAVQ